MVKIRKATSKDAIEILRLFNSDYNITGDNSLKYNKNHIKEYITNKLNKLFIAEVDNKIIGAVLSEFWKKAKYVYLNILIVEKKFRGEGIGKMLTDYVEKTAKKQGYNLLFFYTEVENNKLQKMMKKLKYKRGKKYYFFSKKI